MESNLVRGIVFGLVGCFIGMSTGVAAMGGAVNGAVVFGPIGFVLGWLLPWNQSRHDGEVAAADFKPEAAAPPEGSSLKDVEKSINEVIPAVGRVLVGIWNLQMKLLIAVGVMPFLQKYPWMMAVIAFALLAFLFPMGVVFVVTGFAAMHYRARPDDQFLVIFDPSQR